MSSLGKKLLRGGILLTAGQVLGQGLSLLRVVLPAKLDWLSPRDVGTISLFMMILQLFQMVTDLNMGLLIVQSKDGDEPKMTDTGHAIDVVRSVWNAVLMVVLGWPIAYVFEVPEARWAFQGLAVVMLLRGLMHLDVYRLQRAMKFEAQILSELGGQVAAVVVGLPLAWYLRNYSIVLWSMIAQQGAQVAVSFLMAERPYRWAWDREVRRRMFWFGWPLLFNGLLMFGIFQGDRFVIGARRLFPHSRFTTDDLGIYALPFQVVLAAALLLVRVCASMVMPALAQVQSNAAQFKRRLVVFAEVAALAGGLLGAGSILMGMSIHGRPLIGMFLPKYAGAAAFVGWLGVAQGLRLVRSAVENGALARGDTINPLLGNLARASGFIGAGMVAATGGTLEGVAITGAAGELVAVLASIVLLEARYRIGLAAGSRALLLNVVIMGVAAVVTWGIGIWSVSGAGVAVTAVVAGALVVFWCSRAMREEARVVLARRRAKRASGGGVAQLEASAGMELPEPVAVTSADATEQTGT